MSPPVRENLGRLVEDLLDEELAWIGARRHRDPAALKAELLKPGRIWLAPEEARRIGLVDTLLSRADWEEGLERRFPDAVRLSISEWISSRRHLPGDGGDEPEAGDHIAVLWAEGAIVPGTGEGAVEVASGEMVERIRALREAGAVKAVVLRVESPGGSALASEEVYQELVKLGREKPLWVSAGPVAASGGYYLAAPGKQIWVSPFTVTGSIGVVALLPDLSGAAGKLGVAPQGIHSLPAGRLRELGRPVDPQVLAALQERLGQIYGEFRSRVLAHRALSDEDLTPIAGGRVWSGRRAVSLGLADHLGGLQPCLDSLQASLGGAPLPVVDYPRQRSLLDLLLDGRVKPRDLLPGARWEPLADELGGGDLLSRLARRPGLLADPRWSLRAELPLALED
jgi:protease-4